ncbi:MAG: NAD(+)/NADH kinase [bacterium]
MQKIGIITKPDRENLAPILKDIVGYLEKNDKQVLIEDKTILAAKIDLKGYSADEIASSADMLIALGGDGTLLNAARLIGRNKNIPLLGVNIGSLGFLTETTEAAIFSTLDNFFGGKYAIEERMMLDVDIQTRESSAERLPRGEDYKNFVAFNEIVICKNNPHRMINIVVYIDNKYVNTFKADGLIVSTPTGSTAYSLSAGGPLLLPSLNAFVITPICSHSLNNRSIVISGDSEVEVKLDDGSESASINLDGQVSATFGKENIIKIKKSPIAIKLVQLGDKDYYELWRRKLSWGKRE